MGRTHLLLLSESPWQTLPPPCFSRLPQPTPPPTEQWRWEEEEEEPAWRRRRNGRSGRAGKTAKQPKTWRKERKNKYRKRGEPHALFLYKTWKKPTNRPKPGRNNKAEEEYVTEIRNSLTIRSPRHSSCYSETSTKLFFQLYQKLILLL